MTITDYAKLPKEVRDADLAEASEIIDGRTKRLPERRHLLAMNHRMQRMVSVLDGNTTLKCASRTKWGAS